MYTCISLLQILFFKLISGGVNYRDSIASTIRHVYLFSIRSNCNSLRILTYFYRGFNDICGCINYRDKSTSSITARYICLCSIWTDCNPFGLPLTLTIAVRLFVAVSITETLLFICAILPECVTYTFVPSGVIATPKGFSTCRSYVMGDVSISTVSITVSVAVSII